MQLNVFLSLNLFVLALITLWPVLRSAFSGDDTFDSLIPMQIKFSDLNPWKIVVDTTVNWRDSQGRFFPISLWLRVYTHYLLPGRAEYKIAQLLMVLSNLMVFTALVGYMFRKFAVGALATLAVISALQFRVQYDGILQFNLQQPFLTFFFLLSLLLFLASCRRNSNVLLFASMISYTICLLTYESTILLIPTFWLLTLFSTVTPKRVRSKFCILISIPPAAAFIHLLYLRSLVTSTTPGYTSNLNPIQLIPTLAKQLVAALPLSYRTINPPEFMKVATTAGHIFDLTTILAALLIIASITLIIRRLPEAPRRQILAMALAGLTLWFAPAIVVAQTVRWQDEIVWGNAYIPVYMEYFGFSLTITSVILWFRSRFAEMRPILRGILVAFATSMTIASSAVAISGNRVATSVYDVAYLWPRENTQRAAERGVFSALSSQSILLAPDMMWWNSAPFIRWSGGPRLQEFPNAISSPLLTECGEDPKACVQKYGFTDALIQRGWDPHRSRFVAVGSLRDVASDGTNINALLVSNPRIYVEVGDLPVASAGEGCASIALDQAVRVSGDPTTRSTMVAFGDDWCLVDIQSNALIDLLQIGA